MKIWETPENAIPIAVFPHMWYNYVKEEGPVLNETIHHHSSSINGHLLC